MEIRQKRKSKGPGGYGDGSMRGSGDVWERGGGAAHCPCRGGAESRRLCEHSARLHHFDLSLEGQGGTCTRAPAADQNFAQAAGQASGGRRTTAFLRSPGIYRAADSRRLARLPEMDGTVGQASACQV